MAVDSPPTHTDVVFALDRATAASVAADDAGCFELGKCRGVVRHGFLIASHKSHIAPDAAVTQLTDSLGPPLPEMVFADNSLVVHHLSSGCTLAFTLPAALRSADPPSTTVKVSAATEWGKSDGVSKELPVVKGSRDWTFTTSYPGTVTRLCRASTASAAAAVPTSTPGATGVVRSAATLRPGAAAPDVAVDVDSATGTWREGPGVAATPTDDRIDYDALRRRDPIVWNDDVPLFEDELADHGAAQLSVKVRAMPDSFFLLSRFWLRVDGVLLRVCDTRVWGRFDHPYLLREVSRREANIPDLGDVDPAVLTDPVRFTPLLALKSQTVDAVHLTAPPPPSS